MKKTWIKRMTALALALGLTASLAACNPASLFPLSGSKVEAADLLEKVKAGKVTGLKTGAVFQEAVYDFATELLKESYGIGGEDKNRLLSPLSVLAALGMTANGARGETLAEMERTLLGDGLKTEDLNRYLHQYYQDLPSAKDSRFTFANSIWFRDMESFQVEKAFLQINKDYYNPDIYKAPFDETTVRDINQWVDQRTEHMIPQVLEDLSEDDMIALINALLFDAKWEQPFGSNDMHEDRIFRTVDGKKRSVTMMSHEETKLIDQGDTVGFMKEYAGDKYRFVALMPRDEETDFGRYLEGLDGARLQELLGSVKNQEFMLYMPQFTLEYSTDLVKVLRNMGMKLAFEEGADFSGISGTIPLSIGQVIHKTRLELDNGGTKAAAVTVVTMTKAAGPVPGVISYLKLDRPFVFMIIDTENQLPLFMGVATDIGK